MHNIRNFCIIAHIDHGKSTLADRFLEITGTVEKRKMQEQLLDTMDLERERGITIKLQPVRMDYTLEDTNEQYILNLIDTPGHVDFTYEVSRSLAACEGAILVVDATQGIEAQTIANVYLALEQDLTIIPVLNKIDLPAADVEKHALDIENILGIPAEEIICVSAKDGTNVEQVLKRVIERVPTPYDAGLRKKLQIEDDIETRALIFDSKYDSYKGVLAYIRLVSGRVQAGDICYLLGAKQEIHVQEVGYLKPNYVEAKSLGPGEVGYIVTGLKSIGEARVGDTIWKTVSAEKTRSSYKDASLLPGYKKIKPMVFAGIFCSEGDDFHLLRVALEKLSLNDSALTFETEQSTALGSGFRCGFLGLLHMDIVQERLEREYNLDLVVTAPSVSYKLKFKGGDAMSIKKNTGLDAGDDMSVIISNPSELPDRTFVESILEPWMKLEVVCPKDTIGVVLKLIEEGRGIMKNIHYYDESRAMVEADIPLASLVSDFYDRLKSISSGYASMNYEFIEFRVEELVKVDIMIAGDRVDALSMICHRSEAFRRGNAFTKRLKDIIPRAQFPIALQAAIGGKIIARETIASFRKNVIGGLYGGDRTRKDKLLKKQKEGKKRMKQVGKVSLPQAAFRALLERG